MAGIGTRSHFGSIGLSRVCLCDRGQHAVGDVQVGGIFDRPEQQRQPAVEAYCASPVHRQSSSRPAIMYSVHKGCSHCISQVSWFDQQLVVYECKAAEPRRWGAAVAGAADIDRADDTVYEESDSGTGAAEMGRTGAEGTDARRRRDSGADSGAETPSEGIAEGAEARRRRDTGARHRSEEKTDEADSQPTAAGARTQCRAATIAGGIDYVQ